MSSLGFNYGDLHWNSVKSQIFTGDILDALGEISPQTLYIPDQWNYKDINALYLAIDEKKKTMLIVPIQISINPCHKDSETLFYADWAKWKNKFHGYTLSSTFVWIVEHKCSWNIVEEQLRSLRGGTQVIAPQHKQMHVMVSDVYKPLGERLEARYRRLQKSKSSPTELTFASDVRSRATESQDGHQWVCKAERALLSSWPARAKSAILIRHYSQESEEKIISEDFSEVTEELFKSTQIEAESTVMLTGSKGKAVEKVKVWHFIYVNRESWMQLQDNDGSYKDSADMGASNKGRDVTKEIHKGDKKSTATVKRKVRSRPAFLFSVLIYNCAEDFTWVQEQQESYTCIQKGEETWQRRRCRWVEIECAWWHKSSITPTMKVLVPTMPFGMLYDYSSDQVVLYGVFMPSRECKRGCYQAKLSCGEVQ